MGRRVKDGGESERQGWTVKYGTHHTKRRKQGQSYEPKGIAPDR